MIIPQGKDMIVRNSKDSNLHVMLNNKDKKLFSFINTLDPNSSRNSRQASVPRLKNGNQNLQGQQTIHIQEGNSASQSGSQPHGQQEPHISSELVYDGGNQADSRRPPHHSRNQDQLGYSSQSEYLFGSNSSLSNLNMQQARKSSRNNLVHTK